MCSRERIGPWGFLWRTGCEGLMAFRGPQGGRAAWMLPPEVTQHF